MNNANRTLIGWVAGSSLGVTVFLGLGALGAKDSESGNMDSKAVSGEVSAEVSADTYVQYGDLCLATPPFGWVSDGTEKPCAMPSEPLEEPEAESP